MNRDILVQWLRDRRDNCVRLSKEKFGADRDGWIEDAEFFNWALQVAQNIAVPETPKELTFNNICSPDRHIHAEVWKAVSGSWYARIWCDINDDEVKYMAHASTPQEAVNLAIKYMVADSD